MFLAGFLEMCLLRPIAFLYEMIFVRRLYEQVTTGKV